MDQLITLNQLASQTKLPRDWLHAEALAGRIPCLRIRRKLRFNRVAVEAALSQRASKSWEVAHAS